MRILGATQAHTFATLQKKLPLSTITYDILTQAGPENHSKNDAFFLNQALEGTQKEQNSKPFCTPNSKLRTCVCLCVVLSSKYVVVVVEVSGSCRKQAVVVSRE